METQMTLKTAGSLQRPPTPFTITIAPPAPYLEGQEEIAEDIAPRLRLTQPRTLVAPMLPPALTVEPNAVEVEEVAPMHEVVLHLLDLAQGLDLGADQPYMPEPHTTLREAVGILRHKGDLLIHGGHLLWTGHALVVKAWDRMAQVVISWAEVARLLRASYRSDAVRTGKWKQVETSTDPYLPNFRPIPMPGVGLYCFVPYGTDMDTLDPEVWKPITFPMGVAHGSLYICDLYLDGDLYDIWWSRPLNCYLAQVVSREELLARRPPIPA